MLKSLADGNYSQLLNSSDPLWTTLKAFYKTSFKDKDKGRFQIYGNYFMFGHPEFKSVSLISKSTEICLSSARIPDLALRNEVYYASYPYIVMREEKEVDEDSEETFMTLEIGQIEHRNVKEQPVIPFSPVPVPDFGIIPNLDELRMNDKRINPRYPSGFPGNAGVIHLSNGVFLVFGGKCREELVADVSVIEVFCTDLGRKVSIVTPTVVGMLPPPREHFAWCADENRVYLYAGEIEGQVLSDLWMFEITSLLGSYTVKSTQIVTANTAHPRSGAVMSVVGKYLYVISGKTTHGYEVPISALNLDTFIWKEVSYIGPKAFISDEKVQILPSKDPFITLIRDAKRDRYSESAANLWIFDTNLSRSSLIEQVSSYPFLMSLGQDYFCEWGRYVYKMHYGAHYKCRRIAQTMPALHRLLEEMCEVGLFSDTEIGYKEGNIRLLQCCLAVRGSEATGLLRAVQHPEVLPLHYTYFVLQSIIKYLYTDTLFLPSLPVKSYKGIDLLTPADFLEELMEAAGDFAMPNLRNLCVISLTQACHLANSKVNLYSDYRNLASMPIEPGLSFGRVSSTEAAFAYLLAPDYRLICTDGIIGTHKFVLFMRSSLFRRVFGGGFDLDQEEFTVDFDCATVELAKWYMYTDEINITQDKIVEVMRIAAFLGVSDLFQLCQKQAACEINYGNLMATYDLALQLNATELKEYCEDIYLHCNLGSLKEYQDFLAENEGLRDHFTNLRPARYLSKEKFNTLSETEKEALVATYIASIPPAEDNQKTTFFDPVPGLRADLEEIRGSGKTNLCIPMPLQLTKQLSLEDDKWECSNRFELFSGSEEDAE